MASNNDLIASIKTLNPEAVTEGLNNVKLAELLKALKEAKDLEPEPTPEPEAAKAKKGYYVAEGKSVTSLRGIRVGGQPVEAKYFPGEAETLKDLVKRGIVVKK